MVSQESLRVLAVLASPVCPLQEEVLRQPLLGRMMTFIRMQYRVREPRAALHITRSFCLVRIVT